MPNVAFESTRLDPDLTPFHGLAREMAQAFGYTADLVIDRQLAQLVRLRVAQTNHCSYCLILHSLAELAAIVINMNLCTRLKLAQGATPFAQPGAGQMNSGRNPEWTGRPSSGFASPVLAS